jgi:hypothetical protein
MGFKWLDYFILAPPSQYCIDQNLLETIARYRGQVAGWEELIR